MNTLLILAVLLVGSKIQYVKYVIMLKNYGKYQVTNIGISYTTSSTVELKRLGARRPRIMPYATLYTHYYFNTIRI